MSRVAPKGETVRGVDVSRHNGQIDWKKISQSDIGFCFIKATEGGTFKDPMFSENWTSAWSAGVLRGAYHFFRPGSDPVMQADNFLTQVKFRSLEHDLAPVFDWEVHDNIDPHTQIGHATTWLALVESALKKKPIIYTSPSFFTELGGPTYFAKYPLWIANYGVKAPTVPLPWQSWVFWQYSESGIVSGVKDNVDTDLFNGSKEDLLRFTKMDPKYFADKRQY